MSTVTREHLAGLLLVDELDGTVAISDLIAQASAAPEQEAVAFWIDGAPDHTYGSEWFMAELMNGDRVVLVALPEEFSYDYKTADETYFTKSFVRRWAQFPDSNYVPVHADPSEVERLRAELNTERLRADAAVGDANEAERKVAYLQKTVDGMNAAHAEVVQKLAEADQKISSVVEYVQGMVNAAGNQPSVATGYLRDILDALLSATAQPAECQHRYMYFGTQPARRCADCNKVEPAEVKS